MEETTKGWNPRPLHLALNAKPLFARGYSTPESSAAFKLRYFKVKHPVKRVFLKLQKSRVYSRGRSSQNGHQVATEQGRRLLPAVLHQIVDYFVQDPLKQGGADPQVLDGQRREVGQLRQLPHILLQALDLVSPLRPAGGEKTLRREGIHRTSSLRVDVGICCVP